MILFFGFASWFMQGEQRSPTDSIDIHGGFLLQCDGLMRMRSATPGFRELLHRLMRWFAWHHPLSRWPSQKPRASQSKIGTRRRRKARSNL